jgi:hypothetical protein
VSLSNGADYSTIYETSGASAAQTVQVSVTGGLSAGTVHVWSTDMGSSNPADHFARQADVTPSGGGYTLTLQPNRIYSVTTTTGQGKGTAAGPASHGLALPYSDDFEAYGNRALPKYTEDMQGAFEVRDCLDGHTGRCLQQVTPAQPINWQDDSDAFTLLGDPSWTNYTVSADFDIRQAGTVTLLGRAGTQQRPQSHQAAYQLRVGSTGAWSVVKHTTTNANVTLLSGTRSALTSWHRLSLGFAGTRITATLDGTQLGTVEDGTYGSGQVGLGVVGYQTDMFDNVTVTPSDAGNGNAGGTLRGAESGRCADVPGATQTNETVVTLWDCNDGVNQTWVATPASELRVYGAKCLDAKGGATADGTPVIIYDCTGGTNQKWRLTAEGTVVGTASGKCLDATAHATANSTPLELWTCNGGTNQLWSRS